MALPEPPKTNDPKAENNPQAPGGTPVQAPAANTAPVQPTTAAPAQPVAPPASTSNPPTGLGQTPPADSGQSPAGTGQTAPANAEQSGAGTASQPIVAAPAPVNQAAAPTAPEEPVQNKLLELIKHKKLLVIAGGGVLMLFFFLLLLLAFAPKKQPVEQTPPPQTKTTEKPALATVGKKSIYIEDIRKMALEKYSESEITKAALQEAFNKLIERSIIDIEAKRLNITITNDELQERLSQINPATSSVSPLEQTDQKYELLKAKIMQIARESREVYSIGFELPPYSQNKGIYTDEQVAFFETQREEFEKLLPEIEQRLRNGEIFSSLVQAVHNQYPDLRAIMRVNDYVVSAIEDKSLFSKPRVYFYDEKNVGSPLFDTMFSLQRNEIALIPEQLAPGGRVIQVKKINNPKIYTYQDWLNAKKKELVKILGEV